MKCEYTKCGKTFEPKPGAGRPPRYCSLRCRVAAHRERKRAEVAGFVAIAVLAWTAAAERPDYCEAAIETMAATEQALPLEPCHMGTSACVQRAGQVMRLMEAIRMIAPALRQIDAECGTDFIEREKERMREIEAWRRDSAILTMQPLA